ncbi:unnamed protein product [Coffea canephora]|uniref:Flavin-containing monooxygenase n=1 Tax=Coffea canephora TaxID=49390 RepID=A0A068V5P8_COFCA|nr:unnamed protein product [Coffea canephora]
MFFISVCNSNYSSNLQVEYCYENGEIAFKDGALIAADAILHATGFKYDFPFLNTKGIDTTDDNGVHPFYKHVFPPQLAPALSFIGIYQTGLVLILFL